MVDSGANASATKDLAGADLRTYILIQLPKDRVKITGVGGNIAVVGAIKLNAPLDHIWDWHCPDAVANIIALDNIQQRYDTQFLEQSTPRDRIGIFDSRSNTVCRRTRGQDPEGSALLVHRSN